MVEMISEDSIEILNELQRRAGLDFHAYTPQQGQTEFHESQKYIRMLLGGNQSGKSRGAAQEISYWFTHSHPYRTLPESEKGYLIWVISTEYQTIKEGIYRHLRHLLPAWEIASWGPKVQGHDMHGYVKSKRGDEIHFLSGKGGEDARTKFQAAIVHLVSIDEEIESFIWDELQARMLSSGGSFIISATLVNSYDWIVDLETQGDRRSQDVFLTRLHTDKNPYTDERQVARLRRTWDEDTLRVRFYGKSARQVGLIYKNFNQQHILPEFIIPRSWPRWHAFDPGFRVAGAVWVTVSPQGQMFLYRVYYGREVELGDTAREFKLLETEGPADVNTIDDKEGSRTLTGQLGPSALMARDFQRYYLPAVKAVHAGIEQCRSWLKIDPDKSNDTITYELDTGPPVVVPAGPRFFVFETCSHFIDEIKKYKIKSATARRGQNEPVDKPIKRFDHLMDPWRYVCMLNPTYFVRETYVDESEPYLNTPLSMEEAVDRCVARRLDGDNMYIDEQLGVLI